jgi:Uma2 family endonuclease
MNLLTQPALQPKQVPTRPGAAEQRLLLDDVDWQAYVTIGEALRDRPGLRMTYDRGRLEFMTTSPEHEIFKKWLSRFIETLAEEFNRPITTAGNMTFQREDLARALEADDCFWVAHEPQMRAKLEWDPHRDPPPDLALEIEISRSAIGRMAIYAALRVPEVWRFDGETLRVHLLQPDGTYQPAEQSPSFPGIPLAELVRFLRPSQTVDYLSVIREFRAWVREQIARNKQQGQS